MACNDPSLADDASATFTLVVTVSAGTPNGTVISDTATVSSSTTDPSTGKQLDDGDDDRGLRRLDGGRPLGHRVRFSLSRRRWGIHHVQPHGAQRRPCRPRAPDPSLQDLDQHHVRLIDGCGRFDLLDAGGGRDRGMMHEP